jgi:hypothetical protein
MDHGVIVENVPKEQFFTNPGARAEAFLSKLLSH